MGKTLEEMIKLEVEKVEVEKNQWLASDKWSEGLPGLFKLEFEGFWMITLCSKCYFREAIPGGKNKFSTKGMSKKQNKIT